MEYACFDVILPSSCSCKWLLLKQENLFLHAQFCTLAFEKLTTIAIFVESVFICFVIVGLIKSLAVKLRDHVCSQAGDINDKGSVVD